MMKADVKEVQITTQPFPSSRKIYVEGTLPGVRVAMREISLAPTRPMTRHPPQADARMHQ